METQFKFVSKEEAHRIIDSIEGDGIFVLTYNSNKGISDNGKFIKKKKGNKYVDKAKTLVLSKSQVATLNLHDKLFSDLDECKREGIVRTILLPRLEWQNYICAEFTLTRTSVLVYTTVTRIKKKKPILQTMLPTSRTSFFNIHTNQIQCQKRLEIWTQQKMLCNIIITY